MYYVTNISRSKKERMPLLYVEVMFFVFISGKFAEYTERLGSFSFIDVNVQKCN